MTSLKKRPTGIALTATTAFVVGSLVMPSLHWVHRKLFWHPPLTLDPRHAAHVDRIKAGGCNVLFLGDSITDWWRDQEVWQRRMEPLGAVNFGVAGDTTADVLWRAQNGELEGGPGEFKWVVLLVGTNDFAKGGTPETVRNGVEAIVWEINRRAPSARVLLVGLTPSTEYGITPKPIISTNALLAKVAGVDFIDPVPSWRPDYLVDGVHWSTAGYKHMADLLIPYLLSKSLATRPNK